MLSLSVAPSCKYKEARVDARLCRFRRVSASALYRRSPEVFKVEALLEKRTSKEESSRSEQPWFKPLSHFTLLIQAPEILETILLKLHREVFDLSTTLFEKVKLAKRYICLLKEESLTYLD